MKRGLGRVEPGGPGVEGGAVRVELLAGGGNAVVQPGGDPARELPRADPLALGGAVCGAGLGEEPPRLGLVGRDRALPLGQPPLALVGRVCHARTP
ncbi:hypothetical protein FTUN_5172 [Frigoriglobus tundricola]|uniref:Uncharacterized protein n=1 Tax=Frigoriglobus tundricola TaxID=2774151 RepID=A0A6M5YU33_9BACT|nr:hypothetical protein FTUN_5172 [Frigoriglobus tundricola]